MRTSRTSRIQTWLTLHRIGTSVMLAALIVLVSVVLVREPVAAPIQLTAIQADKVAQAASFLQEAGFNNPLYKGITPGSEGQYPTFTVTAIGGQTLDVWMRTTSNGGWEIQPTMLFESVKSADDFARLAQKAVIDWEHIPADIKPRTDGTFGEYEERQYLHKQLAKYNPDASYWKNSPSETRGWPSK